ncbi:MAG: stage II sporulation protein M [bacterium]|nr:stage II sporulation protein M [bacterium]
MKKTMLLKKDKLSSQKQKYLFLITIMILGFTFSFIFFALIAKEDKTILQNEINLFFQNVKTNQLNTTNSLINSLSSNLLSISLVWLLGISIIGLPFIIFFLFFKSFILGFSIISILANYGLKGILLIIPYLFPHQIIYLIIWLLLSFYASSFSIKLFKILFLKKNLNLQEHFIKYLKIASLCLVTSIICSLFEVYISPKLISLFIF